MQWTSSIGEMILGRSIPIFAAFALLACSHHSRFSGGPDESSFPPAAAPLWEKLAAQRSDDWFHLLNTGGAGLEWRLRAIDSATASIDLQSFLWSRDPVGDTILRRLLAAADRGVRIRILLDDSFLFKQDDVVHAIDSHPNIEYRIFNPYGRRGGNGAVRLLVNLGDFSRLDHRMHNKLMVVDNRVALIGGHNLADEYFGYDSKMNFRDMEVMSGGPYVRNLSKGFDRYWNNRWAIPADKIPVKRGAGINLAALRTSLFESTVIPKPESESQRLQAWSTACRSGVAGVSDLLLDRPPTKIPEDPGQAPVQVAKRLMKIIDSATREVVLVSAYFIPTEELEEAVERAESRGVRVRILTNSLRSNNHISAHSAYRHHLHRLVAHGAELHEVNYHARDRSRYMHGPAGSRTLGLHAKVLVIDHDEVFIGSANLDSRSLRINTEMGLLINSPELNAQVRKALAPDFSLANSWQVRFDSKEKVVWAGLNRIFTVQPEASHMQRLEDWFFALLPIEYEL